MLESKKSFGLPCKDAVYHFLNSQTYNWCRFLLSLSEYTISKVSALTNHHRPKVLIIDDSAYERNRSKKVELLARCFDHSLQKMRFYKGFWMLTLGWSDVVNFMPLDFSLLISTKSSINGIDERIYKRTCGYKRRKEALETAPSAIPGMILTRPVSSDVEASYVLMDTWFIQQPLIKSITEQGIDMIGMVKATSQRYLVNHKWVDLKQLYKLATPTNHRKDILRSIQTTMANDIPVKIVFIRNRNNHSRWMAL
jgi:hypothetical protein